jgi:hypothetical protein
VLVDEVPVCALSLGQCMVMVQGGHGVVFASHVAKFIGHYECRVTRFFGAKGIIPGCCGFLTALEQCRGTSSIGANALSRYRMFVAGSCGCPGAITNLSRGSEVQKP